MKYFYSLFVRSYKKNIIKIITVLVIVTSFFPVYSMEESSRYFKISDLRHISNMNELPIYSVNFPSVTSATSKVPKELVPLLYAIKVFAESQTTVKKNLKKVRDAFSQEASENFNYTIFKKDFSDLGIIKPTQYPVSFFTIIKNWFKDTETTPTYGSVSSSMQSENFEQKKGAYENLISAIRQGQLSYALKTCVHDSFKIETPEDVVDSIFSFLFKE